MFDILDILVGHHPKSLSVTEMALEMRERGYDITIDELKEIFDEDFLSE